MLSYKDMYVSILEKNHFNVLNAVNDFLKMVIFNNIYVHILERDHISVRNAIKALNERVISTIIW